MSEPLRATRDHRDGSALPAPVAERVLARAAELDAQEQGTVPVARLREAAGEAGIAPGAFDAALAEVAGAAAMRETAPWWVRVCLFGVLDRRVAMTIYWAFPVIFLVGVALVVALPARANAGGRLGLVLALAVWMMFSLWSTARAIRWADRHGWDRLP